VRVCCNDNEYERSTVKIACRETLHCRKLSALSAGALYVFNVGEGEWRDCKRKSQRSLLGTFSLRCSQESWTACALKGDVSGKGGSSGMRWNFLRWKCCRGVIELQENLEWRMILNELDDVVA